MASKTVYKCHACEREYKTRREANKCYKSLEAGGFKRGDLVMRDGECWKILHLDQSGVTLDRCQEYRRLSGRDTYKEMWNSATFPNSNCHGEYRMLCKQDIEYHLKRRRMQVRCGENLLEAIKCSGKSPTVPEKTVRSATSGRSSSTSKRRT